MTHDLAASITAALAHLRTDFDALRTGRANPALIESLPVMAYGSTMPLQQLAAINVPEPRLMVVQPWDVSLTKDIEKALAQSSLGISPVVDGNLIRLPFPAMTEERRKEMVKMVHEKEEECRIRVRTAREEAMKLVKLGEADGSLSEDAAEIERQHIQKQVDQANKDIEGIGELKAAEIMTV